MVAAVRSVEINANLGQEKIENPWKRVKGGENQTFAENPKGIMTFEGSLAEHEFLKGDAM